MHLMRYRIWQDCCERDQVLSTGDRRNEAIGSVDSVPLAVFINGRADAAHSDLPADIRHNHAPNAAPYPEPVVRTGGSGAFVGWGWDPFYLFC